MKNRAIIASVVLLIVLAVGFLAYWIGGASKAPVPNAPGAEAAGRNNPTPAAPVPPESNAATKTALDANAPRFVKLTAPPAGPFGRESYDFLNDQLPADGNVWLTVMDGANHQHAYLCDGLQQRVTGELINGLAIFANGDGTKLLCQGTGEPGETFRKLADDINPNSGLPAANAFRVEAFWLLDLRNNSATPIGAIARPTRGSSLWHPAPGFRFGYNNPANFSYHRGAFCLCDLEQGKFQRIEAEGDPVGWWDDHTVLLRETNADLVQFDVLARQSKVLLAASTIDSRLHDLNLTNSAADLAPIVNWNGHDYDFYFTGNHRHGRDTNLTFLLKLNRTGPSLDLVYRQWQERWAGYLDATAAHYLYSGSAGEPGRGGDGSVRLVDLATGVEHTLVPADDSGQYALARFLGGRVIYSRNQTLWTVDLNGASPTRLFVPAAHQ